MKPKEMKNFMVDRSRLMDEIDALRKERDGALSQVREMENRYEIIGKELIESNNKYNSSQEMIQKMSNMIDTLVSQKNVLQSENDFLKDQRLKWSEIIKAIILKFKRRSVESDR